MLSTNANGEPANGISGNPAISADGTVVVFESTATDLIATQDIARPSVGIYLIRLASGQRTRLDVSSAGGVGAGQSMSPAISADGRFVAFASRADLTCRDAPACVPEPSDTNGLADIYLRDTATNLTRRITGGQAGGEVTGPSYDPAISGDGRHVAFVSEATNVTRALPVAPPRSTCTTSRRNHRARQPRAEWAFCQRTQPAAGAVSRWGEDRVSVAGLQSRVRRPMSGWAARHQPGLGMYSRMTDPHIARPGVSTDGDQEWMENSRAPSLDDAGQVLAFDHGIPSTDAMRLTTKTCMHTSRDRTR